MTIAERIDAAYAFIRSRTDLTPEVGLILGSGLGDFADRLESAVEIPFAQIPGFPVPTVEGHAGALILGSFRGRTVAALRGRIHYYEGYSQQEITLPVRVMARLGIRTLVLTNAAGGVNLSFSAGALMLIADHINFSGMNPLMGHNLDAFGPRFPDMSDIYTRSLREKLKTLAREAGIPLQEGVYMMYSGRSGPSGPWGPTRWACPRCPRPLWPATAASRWWASAASPTWPPGSWTGSWTTARWWRPPSG